MLWGVKAAATHISIEGARCKIARPQQERSLGLLLAVRLHRDYTFLAVIGRCPGSVRCMSARVRMLCAISGSRACMKTCERALHVRASVCIREYT